MISTNKRSLSKSLRNALFITSNGVCQNCGKPIDETFHSDHVIPFVISKQTNVHHMQGLCPACNLRKGSKTNHESVKGNGVEK